ncbi:hypothetical protein GCM10020254_05350 [Streptomyces goshikiensis]
MIVNQHLSPQILLISGGAGSGKTALARALGEAVPGAALVHLDLCYHSDPDLAPSVPRLDRPGRVLDFSDPLALDPARIKTALAAHADAPLVIVEGTFALALAELTSIATCTAYVDTPADIRIVRKNPPQKSRKAKTRHPGSSATPTATAPTPTTSPRPATARTSSSMAPSRRPISPRSSCCAWTPRSAEDPDRPTPRTHGGPGPERWSGAVKKSGIEPRRWSAGA